MPGPIEASLSTKNSRGDAGRLEQQLLDDGDVCGDVGLVRGQGMGCGLDEAQRPDRFGLRAAASIATSPPMEWPTR